MRERGFSLVELMVVLAIMGILSAFTASRLPTWSTNIRVKSSAKEIASALQLARMKAIAQNTDVTICFYGPSADFPEPKYADGFFSVHITSTDWCDNPPPKPAGPPPGTDPFARFKATVSPLPTGKNIERPAPQSRFTFTSRGQARPGIGHIELKNLQKNLTTRITVHFTGRVKVEIL